MSHAIRCLSFITCTCKPCPGECGYRVMNPETELCKECNAKAERHRKDMGITEDEHEAGGIGA